MEAAKFANTAEAKAEVMRLIQERAEGGPDQRNVVLAIAKAWSLDEVKIGKLCDQADKSAQAVQAELEITEKETEGFFLP